MFEKYDELVDCLVQDDVQKELPALKLVNPFIHSDIRERWNKDFGGRLEALNEKPKLASKRMIVFYDYWHLAGLKHDQELIASGKTCKMTPWERIKDDLYKEAGVESWFKHNFVCFIKDTDKSTSRVSHAALEYCLGYFLKLVDAQESNLIVVTNLDVLNILREHCHLPAMKTLREAVFSEDKFELKNKFKTEIIALYHPGHNGQMNLMRACRHLGYCTEKSMRSLMINTWKTRLSNYCDNISVELGSA